VRELDIDQNKSESDRSFDFKSEVELVEIQKVAEVAEVAVVAEVAEVAAVQEEVKL
jgi:hypothetical protein